MTRSALGELIRQSRAEQGLTQTALSKIAKCSQSALSMYERGNSRALSQRSVQNLIEALEIPSDKIAAETEKKRILRCLKYCENSSCPTTYPYVVHDRVHFMPKMLYVDDTYRFCPICTEPLVAMKCQHCSASLRKDASCCPTCGKPYVPLPCHIGDDDNSPESMKIRQWVAQRRSEIDALRRVP